MLLKVKYRGYWFWKRAYIWDGKRWLKMNKELTALQIESDRLFEDSKRFLDLMKGIKP